MFGLDKSRTNYHVFVAFLLFLLFTMHTTNNTYESLLLLDGARIAYEIFGLHHLSRSSCHPSPVPIVLVGGVSNVRRDFDLFADELARTRPGTQIAAL